MKNSILLLAVVATGCTAVDKAKDAVEGATETTVIQASVLAVQDPQDPTIQSLISLTPFAPGTSETVFLADASSPDSLEDSPIEGATASLEGVALQETGGGTYALDPIKGPAYDVGATWTTTVDIGDGTARTAKVVLPPAADPLPTAPTSLGAVSHAAGQPLTVDVGAAFASSVVALIAPDGSVAFTNNPETIGDLYESTKSDTALPVEIPGSAFADSGIYALGVAGLAHTKADDLDGFNTIISKLRAGEMVWTPISVE
jgi:hypothetical protein